MDWESSGIRNSFEYELIDPFDITCSLGWLDGVTACRISESYRGDYRASCRLSLDGAELPLDAMVRVWHTAELDGEAYRHVLGTFMQEMGDKGDYRLGRFDGDVSLQSTMLRLGSDKRAGCMAVPKGKAIVPHFESTVENAGGTHLVSPAFDRSKTFTKGHVWMAGESVLTEGQRCSDALNGYIGASELGEITLDPYVRPSDKTVSYVFPAGSKSPVLVGLSCTSPKVVNKVVVYFKWNDRTYSIYKQVDESHPWHFRKIGRHAVKDHAVSEGIQDLIGYEPEEGYDASEVNEDIYRALTAKGAELLAEHAATQRVWGAEALYAPVKCGEVVELPYSDSPDGELLLIKGMVTQREFDCDASMIMKLTIEEV